MFYIYIWKDSWLMDGWVDQEKGTGDAARELSAGTWNCLNCRHLYAVQIWTGVTARDGEDKHFIVY